jgi:hypothetical protein
LQCQRRYGDSEVSQHVLLLADGLDEGVALTRNAAQNPDEPGVRD